MGDNGIQEPLHQVAPKTDAPVDFASTWSRQFLLDLEPIRVVFCHLQPSALREDTKCLERRVTKQLKFTLNNGYTRCGGCPPPSLCPPGQRWKPQLQCTEIIRAHGFLSQLPRFLSEDFLWPQEHDCQPIRMAKWEVNAPKSKCQPLTDRSWLPLRGTVLRSVLQSTSGRTELWLLTVVTHSLKHSLLILLPSCLVSTSPHRATWDHLPNKQFVLTTRVRVCLVGDSNLEND